MQNIIAVTSGKGGVGKSTITAIIGKTLAMMNYKVLLIDCDLGLKNLDLILDMGETHYDITDVMLGKCELDEAFVKNNENNLYLLSLFQKLDARDFPNDLLTCIINMEKDNFDYIILDSPAGIEDGFYNVINSSNQAIVIVNDSLSSYSDAKKVIKLIKINHITNIKCLLNKNNDKGYILDNKLQKLKIMYDIDEAYSLNDYDKLSNIKLNKITQDNYIKKLVINLVNIQDEQNIYSK